MKRLLKIVLIVFLTCSLASVKGQTVFSVLKSQQKQADQYFEAEQYFQAIPLYENLLDEDAANGKNILRLAQSLYNTRQYEAAIQVYNSYSNLKKGSLPLQDLYRCAEANARLQKYTAALNYYTQILEQDSENELVAKKIWRLNNIEYLFEDSAHYLIRPLPMNTSYSEIGPVRLQKKVIFSSNRKSPQLIQRIDQHTTLPFYQLYFTESVADSINANEFNYTKTSAFTKSFKGRYHIGPAAFYKNEMAMVFVASAEDETEDGHRPLGLHFATYANGEWQRTGSFTHNSKTYSIFDVSINEEGTRLFFTSEMRGGYGGKDIYSSHLENGNWTKPENLGELVNTSKDESFPFIHSSGKLFFSSDGHPGLGGQDIFSVTELGSNKEPENMGYPINSSYDDFGFVLDEEESTGLFSSNRNGKGFDDDIYEFDMDMQTYPFTITGIIKIKANVLSDPSEILPWSNKEVTLVDSRSGKIVFTGVTDAVGNFKIEIPYFSKYLIQINDENGQTQSASLEIQKHNNATSEYEIVMVKDIFND